MLWSREHPRFVGVLHLPPLPGTPYWDSSTWPGSVDLVRRDAELLATSGLDGVLLQSHDRVYSPSAEPDPARVAAMTLYADAVQDLRAPGFVVGVQLLRNDVASSLAVARLTSLDFIRAGALVGATLTTHGWVQPDSLAIMQRRRALEAHDVAVVADIDSSHFQWGGAPVPVADLARKTALVGGDAVVVDRADPQELASVVASLVAPVPALPVVQGGHLTAETLAARSAGTAGGFVRSCLVTPDGRLDEHKAARFGDAVRSWDGA